MLIVNSRYLDSDGCVYSDALPDDAVLESVHAQLDRVCEPDLDAVWVPVTE